jgi:glycosyltransferase involved in cell wall biosynthesis
LFARFGYSAAAQFPLPVTHSLAYLAERVAPSAKTTRLLSRSPLASAATPVRAGNRVIIFHRMPEEDRAVEKLSIIMPVFNEARYCERIIDAVLTKPLPIDKELIIVESNSTDGSREIVRAFEGRPGVKVLYQDRPRGKGYAVRAGLAMATGTIVLIQDADFEYDVEDYDALLEPILQHRAAFVLGSRSLGLDHWKVRRFGEDRLKGLVMNAAQVAFARTFNVLYQQKVTDVNTMFKVFRAECLKGIDLEGDGFELDIELVCRLTKKGYSPMEVPVNYVARGFAEGKKIKFGRESLLSYLAFVRYRIKK